MHFFVIHDNALTASVSVINQIVKDHGPLVLPLNDCVSRVIVAQASVRRRP